MTGPVPRVYRKNWKVEAAWLRRVAARLEKLAERVNAENGEEVRDIWRLVVEHADLVEPKRREK
jgi:tetrahydromethanopterin S-methyltransferase subunit G